MINTEKEENKNRITIVEEFMRRANPKNKPEVKYNKDAFRLFEFMCQIDLDKNFTIAREIIGNRIAIKSLDNHIARLMAEVQMLNKKVKEMEEVK
jgi:hypothetical protein